MRELDIDGITKAIKNADFTTPSGVVAFKNAIADTFTIREILTYEDFLPRWTFPDLREKQHFTGAWKALITEAHGLIPTARTHGVGKPIKRTVRGRHETPLPNPLLIDDVDELYGWTLSTLRAVVGRALERQATIDDLASKTEQIQRNITNGFDDVCETVGMKFKGSKPPLPKDVDWDTERQIYDKMMIVLKDVPCKTTTPKLEKFRIDCTVTFRGYHVYEIYEDAEALRDLKRRVRKRIARENEKAPKSHKGKAK